METPDQEKTRFDAAHLLGLEYLRTMIVLNGGAILAILTFLGNTRESAFVLFDLGSIKCAMMSFLAGITVVLLGHIVSYFYTALPPSSWPKVFLGTKIVAVNTILGLISAIAFVFGVMELIRGVSA